MNEEYVNANKMTEIIKNKDLNEQQLYMNLYKNYKLIYYNFNLNEPRDNVLETVDADTKKLLQQIEDKIYTVNGTVLTQNERVILELKNIVRFIKKNGDRISPSTFEFITNEINELDLMMKKNGLADNDIIKYFKKRISILQAYLGMNIKFLYEALQVFDEEILMSKIKNNTKKYDDIDNLKNIK